MNISLLGVYGAAGCGRGVMPILRRQDSSPGTRHLFVDDSHIHGEVNGLPVWKFEKFMAAQASMKLIIIAVADPHIRSKLVEKCESEKLKFLSVSAKNHVRFDDVEVGEGAIFSPFTTVTSNVKIGRHFHCNINSYVEHDCILGDFVTFAPGVHCNGNVIIEDFAYIGSGAVIKQGRPGKPLVIGKGAVIGMGAVVTKDVPVGAVVVGNPARPISKI